MSLKERVKYVAMKARHEDKLRPWYKKLWGVIFLVLAAIFLIFMVAGGIYIVNQIKIINGGGDAASLEEQRQIYLDTIKGDEQNNWGPKNAPVTIVEFSDFACPFCEQSYAGLKNIRKTYGDRVRIIYRDYPLHDNSIFLALSARCAGEQGKFWEMHDVFFENQDKFNLPEAELTQNMPDLAAVLGLNVDQFKTCISDKRYFTQIKKDYEDGNYLKIQGTPTWFINNNQITGYISEEKLQEAITGLLQITNK